MEPGTLEASPGEEVEFNVKLDWAPSGWTGPVKVNLEAEGLGFTKTYSYDLYVTPDMEPPIESPIRFRIPENAPPTTYSAKITAAAPTEGGEHGDITTQEWEEITTQGVGLVSIDTVEININLPSTPGFLAAPTLVALLAGLLLAIRRQR